MACFLHSYILADLSLRNGQLMVPQSPKDVLDYHCHIVGHGDSGSECYLHSSVSTCIDLVITVLGTLCTDYA